MNNTDNKTDNKSVISLAVGHLGIDSYSGFLNPIMPFIAYKLGISLAIATAIISVSHLCSSIIQPFFGYVSDILKKRFFIVWGMIIASVFLSLTGIVDNPLALTFCLAMGSLGVAFYHPQATSFVKLHAKDNSTKWMSLFLAGGTVGFSLGPLISSSVTSRFGLEGLPFLMFYGLVIAFLIFKFVPKISTADSFDKFKEKFSSQTFFNDFLISIKDCFTNKDFQILFAIAVAKCLTVSSFCVFLPFLWQKIGYDVTKIGFLVFLFVSAGALATVLSSFIEKYIGALKIYYLSMLTTLPLTLIFLFTYNVNSFIAELSVVLVGFFALLAIPINMIMAQNSVPKHRGLVSGFIGGFSWGIVGLLLPLTGFIAEKIGIPTLLIAISLVPFVTAFFVKKLNIK